MSVGGFPRHAAAIRARIAPVADLKGIKAVRREIGSLCAAATILMLCAGSVRAAPPVGAVTLSAPPTLLSGDRPHLRISGLTPRTPLVVEAFRIVPQSVNTNGQWSTVKPVFHARATFWADSRGRVEVDRSSPVSGTYAGADPRGLLWSGTVAGRGATPAEPPDADTPSAADLADGKVVLRVRVAGKTVAKATMTPSPAVGPIRYQTVDTPELVGVYAAPRGARNAPVVIYLHGSEGGDFEQAKIMAGRYASHGYAAFAPLYFSWPYQGLKNPPAGFSHLPLERIAAARTWIGRQPEADVRRLGIVGASKGSEFALLAASRYPWVKAIVACVPTSVVWGSFGTPPGSDAASFTFTGQPLAVVPYDDYGPVLRNEITSAEWHRRAYASAGPETIARATIPVERIAGQILLISGGRDAIWPSDAMSAEIVDRLGRYGRTAEWLSLSDAGHFVCGAGDAPTRYFEGDEAMSAGGSSVGNGRGAGMAWERTLGFLGRVLRR